MKSPDASSSRRQPPATSSGEAASHSSGPNTAPGRPSAPSAPSATGAATSPKAPGAASASRTHSAPASASSSASSKSSGSSSSASSSATSSSSSQPTSSRKSNAEAILAAIQSANRARGPADDRRSTRYHYCVPMTLHIDDPRSRGTRVIRAATSNISVGGFAFIFDSALSAGSTIRAQFDSLPGKPEIAGLVRSCVHICGTQHRIGVEYQ